MLLITGITGYSGNFFLQELINHKYPDNIRCLIRKNSDTTLLDMSGLKIEKVICDLSDINALNDAFIGVTVVIHIAWIINSRAIIEAAVKNNVQRVICVHTTGIYSNYKSASEDYKNIESSIKEIIEVNNSSMGLIYLRPTMIYGMANNKSTYIFIKMVDKLRVFPIVARGKFLLQPVHGKDLGKAYYQVLEKTNILNGDYILSGEKSISILALLNLISNYLEKKTVFISIPLIISVFLAKFLKLVTINKLDFVEKVQRMGEDRSYSYESAARDFGYAPMSFEEGLKSEVYQYIQTSNSKSI